MPNPVPADRPSPVGRVDPAYGDASRFRLPVEPPTRNLLIASLASIAGACQLFAWALARLPVFFLAFGIALIVLALGVGLAALVRHYRLRWVVYVGPEALVVLRGRRRRVLQWNTVRGITYEDFRLRIRTDDGRDLILAVDRTRPAHDAARDVTRAIEARLAAR